MERSLELCALVASVAMPFFNIPLIARIISRRCSDDISITWVVGVYACILLLFPYGFLYGEFVLKVFSLANIAFFSVVVFVTILFRVSKKRS
ncbi:MAG: hypothetical protein JW938_00365 [Candidatus Omnitrophica bacterium]|nr:hypothetical protein [Candidatus Omnitrophota bacterium]